MAKKRYRNKVRDIDMIGPPKEDCQELFSQAIEAIKELSPEELLALAGEATPDESPQLPHEKRPKKPIEQSLDLHGLTAAEAKAKVKQEITASLQTSSYTITYLIITGRGRHSGQGGGVLFREVYQFVIDYFQGSIERIDAPPADTVISGVAFRGSFRVSLKRR